MASKYELEAVFNLIDKITKPLDKIGANSKAVSDKLKRDFTAAQKKVDALGKSFVKWGKRAALAGAAAAAAFAGKGVKDAAEFQTALAKVQTIADTTKVSMKQFSEGILDLSSKTGVAATEIGESTYAAISAGVDTAKAVSFVEVATKAAVGGFTDTATAIDGLTSILNAYGLSADKAMDISDQMLLTQNLGKTSFGDMAKSIGQVIPTAAALNVKTDELFASVASLTGTAGYDTAKAMTGLNRALIGIMKPSSQASEMAARLGLNFSAAGIQSRGFAQTIRDIYRATGGNQDILGRLFGSAEALKVVNVLGGSGSALFEKTLVEMQNAAGATQRAFETMMDTPEKRWSMALNKMKNAGINLGTALLPVVEKVIEKITGIADRLASIDFSQYSAQIESVFSKIEGLVSGFINLIEFAWQFRGVIMAIVIPLAVYHGILTAIAIVSGPVKAAIFALTLTMGEQTAALTLLKSGTLGYLFVDKLFTAATTIRNGVLNLLTGGTLVQTAATASMAVANGTATASQWLLNAAMTANPIGLVIAAIAALIIIIVILAKNWDRVTDAIKNNSEKVMAIISIFTGPFGFIISYIKELFTNWHRVTEAFESGGILGAIKKIGVVILSGLLAPVQGLLEIISHLPGLGNLAGKGAEKIAGLRNSLLGDDSNITAKIKIPKVETPPLEPPDLSAYEQAVNGVTIPGLEAPDIKLPEIAYPDMNIPGIGASGGRSALHGVVDISGGAAGIPALGGIPGTQTVTSAVSPPAVVDNTPQALLSIDRTVQTITALIQSIDTTATAILNKPAPVINANMPALRIPAQAVRTPYKPPAVPRRYNEIDQREQEDPDREDPRRIPPVSREERMAYSLQERREIVEVQVAAARGTEARVVRQPKSSNIRLTTSGGNA